MPSPNTLTKKRGKVYLGDHPISKALQPVAKPFFDVEAQMLAEDFLRECGFIEPDATEECGADGILFKVQRLGDFVHYNPGGTFVCPRHLVATLGDSLTEEPKWVVTLVQEEA